MREEELKRGGVPPEAHLEERRVQMTNNITGDKYYPRPTHASLAIRALKNRQTRCNILMLAYTFNLA